MNGCGDRAATSGGRSAHCATVERVTSIVETQLLKLREFGPSDLDELAAMVADEEQMRFYPRPKTRDEASAWITDCQRILEESIAGYEERQR